jgi:hypothetical protein
MYLHESRPLLAIGQARVDVTRAMTRGSTHLEHQIHIRVIWAPGVGLLASAIQRG